MATKSSPMNFSSSCRVASVVLALIAAIGLSARGEAATVVGEYTNITAGTFTVSNTDLLQTNVSSATGEADGGARNGNFPASATSNESSGANPATTWAIGSTVEYLLDSKWSIGEIAGYTQWDSARAEQGYTLQVTSDGGANWSTLGVVATPDIASGNSASRTRTYDNAGAPIATGINGVRFSTLASADGQSDVYREFDVIKSNLQVGQEQINTGNVLPSPITAVSGDLLETSVASVAGENAGALVRNGSTGTAAENSGANPANAWGQTTTTYNLDVSTNFRGYDIEEINLFSGWNDSRSAQSYQIFYSLVGDSDFIQLGDDIIAGDGTQSSVLTSTYNLDNTAFLTGVDAIRFVQINGPQANDGTGTVYREFDVIGVASVPEPNSIVLACCGLIGLGLYVRKRCRRSLVA